MIIRTIDAHVAGEPLRLIVEGFPAVQGRTMAERQAWVKARHDHIRRALMREPRGHADMFGALLTLPEHPGSDAGVLFMHNAGYSPMSGHGIIGAVTIALERELLTGAADAAGDRRVVLDCGLGPIVARATLARGRVSRVVFRSGPAFVLQGGVPLRVRGRELRADVAFGGAFYAIVDGEAAGFPLAGSHLDDVRRAGMEIKRAVEASVTVVHPEQPQIQGIHGTIFTGPPGGEADLRNVTVFADGIVDRSPCGTGTAAVMAVLAAMQVIGPGGTFVHEGIINTRLRGRIVGETNVGGLDAVVPEIEGDAHITGEHMFIIDPSDPLKDGFRL